MKIYIAGKISDLSYSDAVAKFAKAAEILKRLGHDPVNPMEVNGLDGSGKEYPWVEYMKRDIPVLLGCDAIYLLPDWNDSKGARLERYIAEELKMLVIYESKPVSALVELVS